MRPLDFENRKRERREEEEGKVEEWMMLEMWERKGEIEEESEEIQGQLQYF